MVEVVDGNVTGTIRQYPPHSGKPLLRPKGSPTPCETCAKCVGLPADKRNPTEGHKRTLSAKNQRTLKTYLEIQGSGGGVNLDALARKNMGIIHGLMMSHKEQRSSQDLGSLLALLQLKR